MVTPGPRETELVLTIDGLGYLVATPAQATAAGGAGRSWDETFIGDQGEVPDEQELALTDLHFVEGGGFSFEGMPNVYELARAWDASAPGKVASWPRFASGETAVSADRKGWLVQHEGYLYELRGRYASKYALAELADGVEWVKTGTDHDFGANIAVAGRPAVAAGKLVVPLINTSTDVLQPFAQLTTVGSPSDSWDAADAALTARCFRVWNEKLVLAHADNTIRLCDTANDFLDDAQWAPSTAGVGYRFGDDGVRITDLVVFNAYLVVWKEDGPWYCDENLVSRPGIPDLAGERDEQNGVGVGYANGALLAPHRGGLVRWVPDGPWATVGPEMEGALEGDLTPGWGRVAGVASFGRITYIAANDVANGVASLISLQPARSNRAPYAIHFHQQEEGVTYEDVAILLGEAEPLQKYALGTITDDSAVGTVAWSDPSNASADDATYATAAAGTSHYLKALNAAPDLPDDADLVGVELVLKLSAVPA